MRRKGSRQISEAPKRWRIWTNSNSSNGRCRWWTPARGHPAKARGRIGEVERESEERLRWVRSVEPQVAAGQNEIERLNRENSELRVAFEERTQWGESMAAQLLDARVRLQRRTEELVAANARVEAAELTLATVKTELAAADDESARLRTVLGAVEDSKWLRVGRAVRLGPDVRGIR